MSIIIDDIRNENTDEIEIDGVEDGDVIFVRMSEDTNDFTLLFYASDGRAEIQGLKADWFDFDYGPEMIDHAIEAVGDLDRVDEVDGNPIKLNVR